MRVCGASRTDATRNYGVYKYMAWLRALGALYGAASGVRVGPETFVRRDATVDG